MRPALSISYALPDKYPPVIGVTAFAEKISRACGRHRRRQRAPTARSPIMLDLIFLIGGIALFALAIAYTYACDRL